MHSMYDNLLFIIFGALLVTDIRKLQELVQRPLVKY